ncbi:hypothetical protein [Aquimarina spongiae]|uniref:Uncharacterized protein n=1 Tax=Aquimarina spongiae TaxID=570521 RepID=A0A1M6GIE5_9FLAO|nr:hypothetical protein [Aquimarina spongiae]SHJ09737.1 hypothetical protein SAMN04488508_105298 [Aquimarina spongiae]
MKLDNKVIGKYKIGDTVFTKINPNISLIVRRYIGGVYYCGFKNDPDRWELGLTARALVGS